MRRGEVVEVDIHDLSGSGSGVGTLPDGRVVFVPRTAPGDRARIELTRTRKTFAQGRLTGLSTPSDARRPPACPLYDRCGGCQLQHLGYRTQVEWKGRRIEETLRRVGGLELPGPVEVVAAPSEWRYRNRVRFTLRRISPRGSGENARGRPPRVIAGFHDLERPHRLVDVADECLLPEAGIAEVWTELRRRWGPGARRLPDGQELSLTLRSAVDGVVLVIEGGSTRDRTGRADSEALVGEIPGLLAIWHRPGPADALERIAGEADRTDRWFGEVVPVGSKAFLQVNREVGEALHRDVLSELGPAEGVRVIDAYCGVGAYGRRLAREGARAIGIELDADAVEAAGRDAPEGFTVHRGRVEEVLIGLETPDRMILNPPRGGVDEAVTRWLADRRIPRVVYVSCDPATLARDLSRVARGYRVVRVKGFDLFPQTSHVETVVTLEPRTDGAGPHPEERLDG